MKLDRRELEAVLSLRSNRDFNVFMEAVARETESRMQQLIKTDMTSDAMCRVQGMTRMGTNILEAVGSAETAISVYSEPRS